MSSSSSQGFFGLGFSSSSYQSHDNGTGANTSTNGENSTNVDKSSLVTSAASEMVTSSASSSSALNSMEKLMQSYMHQCLSYHTQQQQLEEQNQQSDNHPFVSSSSTAAIDSFDGGKLRNQSNAPQNNQHFPQQVLSSPVFIPASSTSSYVPPSAQIKNEELENCNSQFASKASSSENKDTNDRKHMIEEDYQQKLQNARNIALKLASKPIPAPQHQQPTISNINTNIASAVDPTLTSNSNYPYAQKRTEFLTKIHSNKLQSHLLKNLNYILKKDEEIHSIQINHLLEQQKLQSKMNHKKRKKHGNVKTIMGGIGTQERSKLQKSIEKNHHSFMKKHNDKNRKKTKCCGLYITGIKQQHQQRREIQQQRTIKELFESYGSITTSTFYLDKKTGLYKGDALIIYNQAEILEAKNEKVKGEAEGEGPTVHDDRIDNFLNMICSQLNGVELPCGSILSVEPADMDYKKKQTTIQPLKNDSDKILQSQKDNLGIKDAMKTHLAENDFVSARSNSKDAEDENDDLDDFFASL